jgi:hypothetical protein
MRLADPCSKTSERRKDSCNSPANSGERFRVVNAPEIHKVAGPVVISEFMTAIQAGNVASSRIDRLTCGKVGREGLAQCYRRAFMPMKTDENKTKQCPQKERDPEDHIPPRTSTGQRRLGFELTSGCRAIQDDRTSDSVSPGHLFLRLRSHVNTSSRMLDAEKARVCSVLDIDVGHGGSEVVGGECGRRRLGR